MPDDTLTREKKADMAEHLDRLQVAILDIDGPYGATHYALQALDRARTCLLDGDRIGGCCKVCDRPLFVSDINSGEAVEMDEGAYCAPCWAEVQTEREKESKTND